MAARVMGSGVVKSGSPIVKLMTSCISASMSKKRRMPEGAMPRTRSERNVSVGLLVMLTMRVYPRARPSMLEVAGAPHPLPRLDARRQPVPLRRQRAGGEGTEHARRVVRHVEVDLDRIVRLHRPGHQESPSAVRL